MERVPGQADERLVGKISIENGRYERGVCEKYQRDVQGGQFS
jgi:hypothetical protein